MREHLKRAYADLQKFVGVQSADDGPEIGGIIKAALANFVQSCQNPAIWAYGVHTRMLMADYIFEIKPVKYIIDEFCAEEGGGGFRIIRSSEVLNQGIDGIIISSFKYRKEIAGTIRTKFPHIRFLDIYQVLHEQEIDLDGEYYASGHPYARYTRINRMKADLAKQQNPTEEKRLYWKLLKELITIKDFPTAIACVEKYGGSDDAGILKQLQEIYEMQLQAASQISERNVLMLCVDGLLRKDLFEPQLKKIKSCIDRTAFFFSNAYSLSTSTFESLIPTYSENSDLRTKYYEHNTVDETDCRFVKEAIRQGRKIFFYTDGCAYINSNHIMVKNRHQSVSEKIWDFLLDAAEEENGLFYVHILYESHYSYPNPYTLNPLVAEGSSIFFDFLPRNGGKLRTNYALQKKDALQYLDDMLAPFLERLRCPMVVFADHGNCVLPDNSGFADIQYPQLTFGEELIQVPLVVRSPQMGVGENNQICSLMDLNGIVVQLLRQEYPEVKTGRYIKVLRSAIYNADFKYLYQKLGYEQGLEAFEAFLFSDGWKLVVYADGVAELYHTDKDEIVEDEEIKQKLWKQVRGEITVC